MASIKYYRQDIKSLDLSDVKNYDYKNISIESNKYLVKVINIPDKTDGLSCVDNPMLSHIHLPKYIKSLSLTRLPSLLNIVLSDYLIHINLSHLNIIELPIIPENVKYLRISNCPLISLSLSDNIETLEICNINIIRLTKLPIKLNNLDITKNSYLEYIELPENVTNLHIEKNMLLNVIKKFPSSLIRFVCVENRNLILLPLFPLSLKTLIIDNTPIIKLTYLPLNMEIIRLSNLLLEYVPYTIAKEYTVEKLPACKEIKERNFSLSFPSLVNLCLEIFYKFELSIKILELKDRLNVFYVNLCTKCKYNIKTRVILESYNLEKFSKFVLIRYQYCEKCYFK